MNNIILRDYIRPNYGSVDKPEAKSQSKVHAQVKSKKGKRNLASWLSLKSHVQVEHYEGLLKWVWVIVTGQGLDYMVQIEAQSTPEFQENVPSQGWQQREEHRVVHHVQVEHYEGLIKRVWVIMTGLVGNPES